MQRFWSYIAVQLGKHAIWVTVIGLLVTIGLGLGITQLEFATGQDSYLNTNEQVYKDNVVYQQIFGGEAMVTLVTMHPGHTVEEVVENTGFEFDRPDNVPMTPAPSPETLALMRETVAPQLAEVYPQFAARVFGVKASQAAQ